jgi:tRNA-specific adenosine deaminase 1
MATSYASLKVAASQAGILKVRTQVLDDVREVLGSWVPNRGDENWGLEVLAETSKKRPGNSTRDNSQAKITKS